jgi:uncharacterized integral membrane protein
MRWVHITTIAIFVAALLIFLIQNREVVSVDFLGLSMRTPLAVTAAIFYALGAVTGSSAFAMLRRSVREANVKSSLPQGR